MARKRRRPSNEYDDDDGDDEIPIRRKLPKRNRSGINPGLLIALVLGGVLAFGLGGCVIFQVFFGGRGSSDSDKITPGKVGNDITNSNYSSPAGIEKVLGPGRSISASECQSKVLKGSTEQKSLADWLGLSASKGTPQVYHWSGKDEDLYVAYWNNVNAGSMAPKRTMVWHYHEAGQKPIVITQSGY